MSPLPPAAVMEQQTPPTDGTPLAIIGGGLAGVTLSIALTHLSIPHKLYESAKCFAEIGAGIACGPNAASALWLIDPRLREFYERCATYNESAEHRDTWFNFRWGMKEGENGIGYGDLITSVNAYSPRDRGRSCVHRAHFLEEAIRLIPPGVAEFDKTLAGIETLPDESGVKLSFVDGTTTSAPAVIGCDGIKSTTRRILLEKIAPEAISPVFAKEFAYRCLFTHDVAEQVLGAEIASNGTLFCGADAYVVIYPVDHGRLVNLVAIHRKEGQSWDHDDWLVPVEREVMLKDFEGWGEPILEMLKRAKESSRWALFDAPHAPTYTEGLVCLVGDAAHASTPNQGAGAAMAFEDAYTLGNLLQGCEDAQSIKKAFRAFDAVRRPRTQKLVDTSRTAGELYEFVLDGVGRDVDAIKKDLDERHQWIWEVDLPGELARGRKLMEGS